MKKPFMKLLSFMLAFAIVFCTFPINVNAAESDYFSFRLINNGTEYEVYNCTYKGEGELTIPNVYNNKPVTSIAFQTFFATKELTKINIPDNISVFYKDYNPFDYCENLMEISVSENNESFCSIDGVLFSKNLTKLYAYPAKKGGTSYSIPNTVVEVGEYAFSKAQGVDNIVIPDSVTTIAVGSISSCKTITVNNGNSFFSSDSNGILYNKDKSVLLQYPDLKAGTSFVIPNTVNKIKKRAFNNIEYLKNITIPSSVVDFEVQSFFSSSVTTVNYIGNIEQWCNINFEGPNSNPLWHGRSTTLSFNGELVENITVPDTITKIGYETFDGCTNLKSVQIPDSVTSLGNYAFSNCSGLTSVIIPDSVMSIGSSAFRNCSSLTSVTISDGVTSIGSSAFSNCSGLTSVIIPDSVTSIDFSAFSYCKNLEQIIIPTSVKRIGQDAFDRCNVLTVYYGGSQSEWSYIQGVTNSTNPDLYNATKVYDCDTTPTLITINSLPKKNTYYINDTLVVDGIKVTADYLSGKQRDVTDSVTYEYDFSTKGSKTVTVIYSENDIVCTESFNVYVNDLPTYIYLSNPPITTEYYIGEDFNSTGIEVLANYSDGTQVDVTSDVDYSYDFSTTGEKQVRISFEENGIQFTEFVTVSVMEDTNTKGIYIPPMNVTDEETITLPVYIYDNPGLLGFSVKLEYDKTIFTPVAVTNGELTNRGLLNDSIELALNKNKNNFRVVWTDKEPITEDGILFYVEFVVNKNGEEKSTIKLSCSQDDTFDESYNSVNLSCNPGIISFSAESVPTFYANPLSVGAGETITIPVLVTNPCELSDFELIATFPTEYMTFVRADGNVTASASNGVLRIAKSNNTVILGDSQIFTLTFEINEDVSAETSIELDVVSADFSGTGNAKADAIVLTIIKPIVLTNAEIYSTTTKSDPNGTLSVPVYIRNNNGIMGFVMNVDYDSDALELRSVSKGTVISRGMFDTNLTVAQAGNCKIVWNHTDDVFDDGVLFTMEFEVLPGVKLDETDIVITYSQADTYNEKWQDVELDINSITVAIDYFGISEEKKEIAAGETFDLIAKYNASDYVPNNIIWKSNNEYVAIVDENGHVITKKFGSAKISAIDELGNKVECVVKVLPVEPKIVIKSFDNTFSKKLDWWKPYSSETMKLNFMTYNCENAARYEWTSSSRRVKVDDVGNVTNIGWFSRRATITLTAYDSEDNIIAQSSVKVRFYKFD